ncbi:hypothetical protein [Nocardia grenadensis]|nr:hypothetical protein [Nocardia grenadensis]
MVTLDKHVQNQPVLAESLALYELEFSPAAHAIPGLMANDPNSLSVAFEYLSVGAAEERLIEDAYTRGWLAAAEMSREHGLGIDDWQVIKEYPAGVTKPRDCYLFRNGHCQGWEDYFEESGA